MDYKTEILKSIQIMIDKKISSYKGDRTFPSIIKKVNNNNTYIILAEDGSERTVYSSIPSLNLQIRTKVWVKIPCGNINNMHICGIRQ